MLTNLVIGIAVGALAGGVIGASVVALVTQSKTSDLQTETAAAKREASVLTIERDTARIERDAAIRRADGMRPAHCQGVKRNGEPCLSVVGLDDDGYCINHWAQNPALPPTGENEL